MTLAGISFGVYVNPFTSMSFGSYNTTSYSGSLFSASWNTFSTGGCNPFSFGLFNCWTPSFSLPSFTMPTFSLPSFSLPSFSTIQNSALTLLQTFPFLGSKTTTKTTTTKEKTSTSSSLSTYSGSNSALAILTANPFNPSKGSSFGTLTSKSSVRLGSNIGQNIVSIANSYLGYNESNGSYKLFTYGRTEAWCADFATYVIKEAFKRSGKLLPLGFGSTSVDGLRNWGLVNNCYLRIAGKSNKASLIKTNVKAGDIIILKENGASHTGIVDYIASDGTIHTIEGNTSNKVAKRSYSPNNASISGFVQMA